MKTGQAFHNVSDEEICRLVAKDDTKAFSALFDRYFHSLCRFAYRLLKSKDLAEDTVSEVFVSIWTQRKNVAGIINIKVYLLTAVRNRAFNTRTGEREFQAVDQEAMDYHTQNMGEAILEYDELKEAVDKILGDMPSQRQLVFRMNRFDGLRYKEIAEILSISVSAVQKHMSEAVRHLQEQRKKIGPQFDIVLLFFGL